MEATNSMSLFFHTGLEEIVLLQQWKTGSSNTGIALACVAIFFVAAAIETIQLARLFLNFKYIEQVTNREATAYEMCAASGNKAVGPEERKTESMCHHQPHIPESTATEQSTSCGPKDESDISQKDPADLRNISLNLSKDGTTVSRHKYRRTTRGWIHLLCSLLFILQTALGYIVMLVFMTLNVWLGLSVVLGLAAGYLCFAWLRPNTDRPRQ